jgi:hypothetical protein
VDVGFPAPLETTSPAAAANFSNPPMMATTMKRKRKKNRKNDPFRVQKQSSVCIQDDTKKLPILISNRCLDSLPPA